jgi:hypothetical protein
MIFWKDLSSFVTWQRIRLLREMTSGIIACRAQLNPLSTESGKNYIKYSNLKSLEMVLKGI